LTAREIIAAIGIAAEHWRNPNCAARRAAHEAIAARTHYDNAMIGEALDALFGPLTEEALNSVIVDELGSLDILDHFMERPSRPAAHARGVERVVIISSDTTIGVAIPPTVFALCAKSQVTVRDRSDDLISRFRTTLVEIEPRLTDRFTTQRWTAHDDPQFRTSLATADAVVAFGGDEALGNIRAQLAPQARFIPYGHSTSAAYLEREALAHDVTALARDLAHDALLYDGDGCLSLHLIFVERGGTYERERFLAALGHAIRDYGAAHPLDPLRRDPRVAAARDRAAFRAALGHGRVIADDDAATLLIVDQPEDEGPPLLRRAISLIHVDEPDDALAYLRQHSLPLEALATATENPREDILRMAIASGAARVARCGRLQFPPFTGEHGGQRRIEPFVRWIYRA
jgi:hypothetical protein